MFIYNTGNYNCVDIIHSCLIKVNYGDRDGNSKN